MRAGRSGQPALPCRLVALASAELNQRAQPVDSPGLEVQAPGPPAPIALAAGGGNVHPPLGSEFQPILHGQYCILGTAEEHLSDHLPDHLVVGTLKISPDHILARPVHGIIPAACGVVVMRPGIDDTVVYTVVGKVCIGGIQLPAFHVEGKLKDFHAGEVVRVPEILDVLGYYSQILCNDGKIIAQCLLEGNKQLLARSFNPGAVHRGFFTLGNFPICGKTTEVVYAYNVTGLQGFLDSLDPPGKALLPMGFPVIDGITPQLSVIGKRIRRHTAGNGLPAILVNLEQVTVCPCIHTVRCDKYGYVTDDLNAVRVGIALYFLPLGEEEVLLDLDDLNVAGELFLSLFQGCCFS
ncbi:hypothetical protein SDC9_53295 [bioreactor metagenome]|uniref:Uncharacterized protein n=1 Tax=bioreactor metagenome TaxID=1076179 RepID=A0A644WTU8_9ZZZZ